MSKRTAAAAGLPDNERAPAIVVREIGDTRARIRDLRGIVDDNTAKVRRVLEIIEENASVFGANTRESVRSAETIAALMGELQTESEQLRARLVAESARAASLELEKGALQRDVDQFAAAGEDLVSLNDDVTTLTSLINQVNATLDRNAKLTDDLGVTLSADPGNLVNYYGVWVFGEISKMDDTDRQNAFIQEQNQILLTTLGLQQKIAERGNSDFFRQEVVKTQKRIELLGKVARNANLMDIDVS